MGAAAICIEEVGENAELRESLASFAKRNEVMMKELVAAIEAEGGMSRREKDLVDRQAYREARRFLDQAGDMSGTCSGLAKRFNAGEFDLR